MLKITIDNKIKIPLDGLSQSIIGALENRLIFDNPQHIENEKYNRSNWDTEAELCFLGRNGSNLIMPRGFTGQLLKMLEYYTLPYQVDDNTRLIPEVAFTFSGKLHDFQEKAVAAVLLKRFGVLESPTGSGKTIMALNLIASRKQPVLIVVHSKELQNQWVDRINQFLGIPKDQIGIIGNGHNFVGEKITVGIINSIYKFARNIKDKIGFLVIDECHRCPSRTFTEAVLAFDSRYMLGLSATPFRRDGLTKLIYFFIGDRVHSISSEELQATNRIMKASLRVRKTDFDYFYADDYQEMLTALTMDAGRNNQISRDVATQAKNGNGMALVISDRKSHCRSLYKLIDGHGIKTRLLTGDVTNGNRENIVKELNEGKIKALVATSQLIGEGFDLKSLSSIFLTTPIKFSGRTKQYIGRILRIDEGKNSAVIFDYVDRPGVLQASFKSRQSAYRDLGIST